MVRIRRQLRPTKPRKVPNKISHIPPEQLQNGLRFDRPFESRPASAVKASTKYTVKRMREKRATRKPGKRVPLHMSASTSPATSHFGSHSGSIYITPQPTSSYNSTAPPVVSGGFEDVYQYIPPDSSWPSSSVEFLTFPLMVPMSQTPDFEVGLQAESLGDGSYAASANQVLPTATSQVIHWPELWNGFSPGSMPYTYDGQQEALESDLAMMMYAMDFFGGPEPPFPPPTNE